MYCCYNIFSFFSWVHAFYSSICIEVSCGFGLWWIVSSGKNGKAYETFNTIEIYMETVGTFSWIVIVWLMSVIQESIAKIIWKISYYTYFFEKLFYRVVVFIGRTRSIYELNECSLSSLIFDNVLLRESEEFLHVYIVRICRYGEVGIICDIIFNVTEFQ